jgi:hypothetical protein
VSVAKRGAVVATAVLVVGVAAWAFVRSGPGTAPAGPTEVISQTGIHWHPELAIYLDGVKQPIPKDIGISPLAHQPVHTHDADGVVHLEFRGLVTVDDIRLGVFFANWGKAFNRQCVLDRCLTAAGERLTMTVNGQPSDQYERYVMRDGDRIEIRFDSQPARGG